MAKTTVLQSHRKSGLPGWMGQCRESVRRWAKSRSFDYRFVGDELFERIPASWRTATSAYPQIAADLGRLHLIRDTLDAGTELAIWIDADVLVFDPGALAIDPSGSHLFGREVWIEENGRGGYRARRNVHNAVLAFRPGDPVLGFYVHAAERILARIAEQNAGASVPPQVIGPKLLGSLHNIVQFPLSDDVAMISPPVLRDLAGIGDDRALACLIGAAPIAPSAANLSASLIGADENAIAEAAVERLLADPRLLTGTGQRRRQA